MKNKKMNDIFKVFISMSLSGSLLILALLFGLLPSVVAAAESEPFTFTNVELVGTAIVSGSLQEEKLIAKVNHDDKAVIRYMDGSEISTSLRMNGKL